jgi:hypothetical protein
MDGNEKESGSIQERMNRRLAAKPTETESPAKACPFLMIVYGTGKHVCLREGCQLWDHGEENLYSPGCGLVRRTDRQCQ